MHLLLRVCTTSQNPGPWGFEDYQRSPVFHSPWCAVEGWNIKTTFHDLMHVALLGTCRDLFASSLGFWTKQGFYGTGPIGNRLRQFSQRMRTDCKAEKISMVDFSNLSPLVSCYILKILGWYGIHLKWRPLLVYLSFQGDVIVCFPVRPVVSIWRMLEGCKWGTTTKTHRPSKSKESIPS